MELSFNSLTASRLQFAITTLFHMLWPLLSIGLSIFLVIMETAWFRTGKEIYYRHTRFWTRLFLLSFGVGVASGLPLEFQFGTNWAKFSQISGGFFGNILGFEGAMAFMLEAAFLGIMIFAWKRVSRGVHLFATYMVAFGASLSAFWIMDASSWMQTPAGVQFVEGRTIITSYFDAVFNPGVLCGATHMWVACVETTAFVIGGISAWYMLRGRDVEFFRKSFQTAVVLAAALAPVQIYLGDLSGRVVAKHQPAKAAAIESHWETNAPGTGAAWNVAAWPDKEAQGNKWQLQVPGVLSLLATHSPTGQVKGLRDFPKEDQPPIVLPFYSFRVMVAIGSFMLVLPAWAIWCGWRRRRSAEAPPRWLLRAWVAAVPLGFIAVELGWIVREVGRQPWIIYNVMRTSEGVSNLDPHTAVTTLVLYTAVYALLLALFLVFTRRMLHRGPDLESPLPPTHAAFLERGR